MCINEQHLQINIYSARSERNAYREKLESLSPQAPFKQKFVYKKPFSRLVFIWNRIRNWVSSVQNRLISVTELVYCTRFTIATNLKHNNENSIRNCPVDTLVVNNNSL